MQLVTLTIISFIIAGGIGMYFGNKRVHVNVAKQRWLKYITYILITSFIVIAIWFHFFSFLAFFIALFGYYELIRTIHFTRKSWLALIIYSVVVAGFIFYAMKFKREYQFFFYLQVVAFDAFSQVVGQLVGKTAITPKISPSKTWEGLSGGIFFCILSSVLTGSWLNISIVMSIVFGLVTSMTGFFGDILASFYKRIAGIKDYSSLLPGQGGFLDRFDSFMMSAFCYSIIYLVLPGVFS